MFHNRVLKFVTCGLYKWQVVVLLALFDHLKVLFVDFF